MEVTFVNLWSFPFPCGDQFKEFYYSGLFSYLGLLSKLLFAVAKLCSILDFKRNEIDNLFSTYSWGLEM